jgi:hypothetical protein
MTQQQRVLGPALMAELKHISNAELSKAIQLVEQAFQLSASEPTRASRPFAVLATFSSSFPLKREFLSWWLQLTIMPVSWLLLLPLPLRCSRCLVTASDAEHREVVRKVVDVYILHIELERVKLSARASGEQKLVLAGTAAQQQQKTNTATAGRSQSKLSRLSSSEPLPQKRDSHSYLQLVAVEERSDSESRSGSGECGTKPSHSSSAGGDAAAAAKSKKKASKEEKKMKKKTSSSRDKDRRKEEGKAKEREKSAKHHGKEEKDGNSNKKQEEKSEQKKEKEKKKKKEKKEGKEAKEKRKRKNTCELIEVETISSTRKRPDEGSRRASTPSRSASTIVASSSPSLTPASSSDALGEDSLDDARLLRALNGWRKARGHGSSDILGYCSLRPTAAEEKKEKTTPTAGQADESLVERRTKDDKAAAATEQPADELHKLYPNLHSAFCNKLLDKWAQEQPNTI